MDKLSQLRGEMDARGLDALIVPHSDEYQNEYLPDCSERLAWLTGFTGSAGLAIVMADKAVIFVDGRYTLQVREEVDTDHFHPVHVFDQRPEAWLKKHLKKGQKLGFEGSLHTIKEAESFFRVANRVEAECFDTQVNLIDLLWQDRPDPPVAQIRPHDIQYAGIMAADKIASLAEKMQHDDIDATVLTRADSICWILNIRGDDIAYNPLVLSSAILHADGKLDWFVNPQKTPDKMLKSLPKNVTVHLEADFLAGLKSLRDRKVGLDHQAVSHRIEHILMEEGAVCIPYSDPCLLPKSRKNPIEQQGARDCHLRDGLAMTKFLYWLTQEVPKGQLTESVAADKLTALREKSDLYRGKSFETISAVGPHGAIVHYRVEASTNRPLTEGEVYLVDSGAQYLDGTTDITRTILLGDKEPEVELRDRFTRVLKGHIALATVVFPVGTLGSQLDVLARKALWDTGLDFHHGTGHGVGSYLSVHEGPIRISKQQGETPLEAGMILSNEPGFYKDGEYGIRLENLIMVQPAEQEGWLQFENLTLAPFDTRLIDESLLNSHEKEWLSAYHDQVSSALRKNLTEDEKAWLMSLS